MSKKLNKEKEKFNIGENPLPEINYPGCVYTKDDIEEAKQIRKEENKEIIVGLSKSDSSIIL